MKRRAALCALVGVLASGLPLHGLAASRQADFGTLKTPVGVRTLADWVVRSEDHGGRVFALLDKSDARLYVFDPAGKLKARSPVLLGLARGDHTVPGIGDRPLSQVRPEERTTPAGRFELEAGRNLQGEDILWVDYAAGVSIHRLRANNPAERRVQRLGTPSSADNRISFGCINVPANFFDTVMKPSFSDSASDRRGVLYILPEVQLLTDVFPGVKTTRSVTEKSVSLSGRR